MTFTDSVSSFFNNYFVFKGRSSRSEYWYAILFCFLIGLALQALEETLNLFPGSDDSVLAGLFNLITVIPCLSVFSRRMHDVGRSGWWYLLIFTIIGIIPVLIWLTRKGTEGPNKFGCANQGESGESDSGDRGQDTVDQFEYLYGDLVAMLAKMAKSDGVISEDEISTVSQLFDQLFSTTPEKNRAIAIFRKSKDSFSTFEQHARAFASTHSGNYQVLKATLESLFCLSISDGGMSAEEELLLNAAESILGTYSEGYAEYKRKSKFSSQSEGTKDSVYYAKVLGLSGKVTKDEVRKRYKELVMQYHPDKVSHLGERLKEVAHEEIKKINEAYEYLKKSYDV